MLSQWQYASLSAVTDCLDQSCELHLLLPCYPPPNALHDHAPERSALQDSGATATPRSTSPHQCAASVTHRCASPPRAPTSAPDGLQRTIARSGDALSCIISEASGLNRALGRAFQACGRRGHIGATSGPRTSRSQRTTPVTSSAVSSQLIGHIRPSSADRHHHPEISDMEAVMDLSLVVTVDRRAPERWSQAVQATVRWSALGPCRTVEQRQQRSPTLAAASREQQVAGLPAQAAGMMRVGDSDCGPDGLAGSGTVRISSYFRTLQ
jgi:hypothetical protein